MKLFKDHDDKTSSMRVVSVFCIVVTIVTWAVVCVEAKQIQHWTTGDAFFMMALMGGKAAQSLFEKKAKAELESEGDS